MLEGKKLPENLRKPSVKFSQLLDDALAYSKRNKRSYKTDVPRFASLDEWFGSHPAEALAPKEIENTLARAADKKNVGAVDVQSLPVADVSKLPPGNPESKSHLQPRSVRDAPSRG